MQFKRTLSKFFKSKDDSMQDVELNLHQTNRKKDLFNSFLGHLKYNLKEYKKTGELPNEAKNLGFILFQTDTFPKISLSENLFSGTPSIPSIKIPENDKNGLEFFDHFNNDPSIKKILKKFQKWMIMNEMPEIYVYRSCSEDGRTYASFILKKDVNIRHF